MTTDITKLLLQQIKDHTEAYAMLLDTAEGRMPCRISDDPTYDYSHYDEGTGPYKQHQEEDCFDAFREQRDRAGPPEPDPNEPNDYESKSHGY